MTRVSVSTLLVAMAVAGCEAQFSVSTAKLTEPNTAASIDAETKAPAALASTFAANVPAIYATAKLANAPDDTKIKATFHYLEGGDREIAGDEIEAGGSRYVAFTLSAPTAGWPPGQYEARFYLNGKEVHRKPFNVTAATAAAPASSAPRAAGGAGRAAAPAVAGGADAARSAERAASPATSGTKHFRDETFGIDFEMPSNWAWRLTPSKNYLLEGPKGTDSFELSVILQFVTKAGNAGSSAVAQAQKLAEQIAGAPNGAIKTRDTLTMAGQEAPYFVGTYTTADSRGAQAEFGHTQIVLDHGDYYYLISYSGPLPIYQKHLAVFQNMAETFRFTK